MVKDVIIACDFAGREQTLAFLDLLYRTKSPIVKDRHGAVLCRGPGDRPGDQGAAAIRSFLDLKLRDIPNTVRKAMAVPQPAGRGHDATSTPPAPVDMMQGRRGGPDPARRHAPAAHRRDPADLHQSGAHGEATCWIEKPLDDVVMHYARNATREPGWTAWSARRWRPPACTPACGADFLTVTPGVRFADSATPAIRSRVTTPAKAQELGSDYHRHGPPHHRRRRIPVEAYRRAMRRIRLRLSLWRKSRMKKADCKGIC